MSNVCRQRNFYLLFGLVLLEFNLVYRISGHLSALISLCLILNCIDEGQVPFDFCFSP